MRLPNLFNNRAWSSAILLAAGVLIGSLATGAIVSYSARNTSASPELVPQGVSTEGGAAAQPPIVPSLPAGQETGSTASHPSQIDRGDLDTYLGIPVGFTEEGSPYLGDPSAPITLEEYSDFLCPFCARHFKQTWPTLLPDPSGFLASVAEGIGVDMAAYQACLASGGKDTRVNANVAAGSVLGFNGPPSFQFIRNDSGDAYTLVGAQPLETFTQWLDALMAGQAPPQEEEPPPPELPYWANAEGLAPDPERPGFTLAGDAYKGNPDAKLVVVEFSDFQCPACGRHALETQPALDKQFVDAGQIMWVFKHLPLKEHPYAPATAVAAECAGDQGQFWDMHDLLFKRLDAWSTAEEPDAALLALAEELNLDVEQFSACLGSRQAMERVLTDVYDAQDVVQTTPSFIAIYGGKGAVFRGSRPVNEFVSILQDLLEQANAVE